MSHGHSRSLSAGQAVSALGGVCVHVCACVQYLRIRSHLGLEGKGDFAMGEDDVFLDCNAYLVQNCKKTYKKKLALKNS